VVAYRDIDARRTEVLSDDQELSVSFHNAHAAVMPPREAPCLPSCLADEPASVKVLSSLLPWGRAGGAPRASSFVAGAGGNSG
jgi:hypothetical protein